MMDHIDDALFAAPLPPRPGATTEARIVTIANGTAANAFDTVATEEPLEIRLRAAGETRSVAITMRTPGNDFELAAGFLSNEGVVSGPDAIAGISYCIDRDVDAAQRFNIVNVDLTATTFPAIDALERHFLMTSACGICGKAQLDALRDRGLAPLETGVRLAPELVWSLPDRMRDAQRVFAATGGLHAAALFAADGSVIAVREDVGRHNALDKLVGWGLLERTLPFADRILLVSGRASYELVQKAVSAGIPFVCSVSAPSSLAVDVARDFGVTLMGFVRHQRFNIYASPERILSSGRG